MTMARCWTLRRGVERSRRVCCSPRSGWDEVWRGHTPSIVINASIVRRAPSHMQWLLFFVTIFFLQITALGGAEPHS